MKKDPKEIVKTVVTAHDVEIHLADGTVLGVSSNKDSFHFSLSGVQVPTEWGYNKKDPTNQRMSNVNNCYYVRPQL